MLTHGGWSHLFTPVLIGAVPLTACALLHRLPMRRFPDVFTS